MPSLDDTGITGACHRPRTEVGADIQVVAIDPFDARLGFGQVEPINHKCLTGQIELAGDFGIGPTTGQFDQASVLRAAETSRTTPDPVLLLLLGQRIKVQQDLPCRLRLCKFNHRGAPPNAARP